MKEQTQKDKKPLIFEKFCCVSEADSFEELFESDEQNYDYKKLVIVRKEASANKRDSTFQIDNLAVQDKDSSFPLYNKHLLITKN